MTISKPGLRPANPNFSSGPCAKRPGWSPEALKNAALGRSHRAKIGKTKLEQAIDLTREVLQVPADYRIGIVPASDTGAVEMAMWSLLGERGVDMVAWESFGEGWVTDVVKQLKLADARTIKAPYGELPDLGSIDFDRDVVFTWNGTTSGVRVPNGDFIPGRPQGPDDLRRHLGGVRPKARFPETRCRHLLLAKGAGRRGRARHADPQPARRRAAGKLQAGLAAAENLPPDLERQADRRHLQGRDDQHAVHAVRRGLSRRAAMGEVDRWPGQVDCPRGRQHQGNLRLGGEDAGGRFPGDGRRDALQHFGLPALSDPAVANLDDAGQQAFVKGFVALLEAEKVAYDIASYRDAPPGLRIWCGATVETSDVEALIPWLDWAFATQKAALKAAA